MNPAAIAELNSGLPARPDDGRDEARRFLARQLAWERRLDALRRRGLSRPWPARAA